MQLRAAPRGPAMACEGCSRPCTSVASLRRSCSKRAAAAACASPAGRARRGSSARAPSTACHEITTCNRWQPELHVANRAAHCNAGPRQRAPRAGCRSFAAPPAARLPKSSRGSGRGCRPPAPRHARPRQRVGRASGPPAMACPPRARRSGSHRGVGGSRAARSSACTLPCLALLHRADDRRGAAPVMMTPARH